MRIKKITAYVDKILISLENISPTVYYTAVARIPLVHGDSRDQKYPGQVLVSLQGNGGDICFPRYHLDFDLLICRFEITVEGQLIPGAKYVTDFEEGASQNTCTPPEIIRPVGTWVTALEEDIDYLGFGCMMTEVNSAWIQTVNPTEHDIPHVWNGQTYYFDKKTMDLYDRLMLPCIKRGIPCLVRLINRFNYRLKGSDDQLCRIIGHPAYEDIGFSEEMSAFNLRTEEGLNFYCACVDFLCARYADPQSPLFCSFIMDVGNEINAQAVWHNCGTMSCRDYMEEYTQQLRIAHLIGKKYNTHHRVNVSFDHHFAMRFRPDELRYYPAKECLAYLAAFSQRDGDFDWGIAAHPYPEDLSRPDFYHDTSAEFSFDSPRITMKNLEVWQALADLPELQYRGRSRRIVFDEQGFHTRSDDPETENKGAAAFVLLYQKLKKCPSIEQFLINRYADMPLGDESGLCLGLRYENGYADAEHLFITPGDYKKICFAIQDMETDREALRIQEASAYIGEALFQDLLCPPSPGPTTYFRDVIQSVLM